MLREGDRPRSADCGYCVGMDRSGDSKVSNGLLWGKVPDAVSLFRWKAVLH